jgi:hypothetical protein
VNGQHVTVFAGTLRGDPSKGVLLVRSSPKDLSPGNRLKMLAENGDSIWFAL